MAEPFDLVLGAPGSEVTLLLAAVYLQPADVSLLTGAQLAVVMADPDVTLAAPIAFGDSHEGAPVVGTAAAFVEHLAGALAEGRPFAAHEEAVAGASAPVAVGGTVAPAHGHGEGAEVGTHGDLAHTVVGRMAPTGSPWDRAILVPVESVREVQGLAGGHGPADAGRIGPPFDPAYTPGVPAMAVQAEEVSAAYALRSRYTRPDMMAIFPGATLAQLHGRLRDVREAMSLMVDLSQVLVVAAVLAGLVLLARLFARNLALLRAVRAPRRFVLAVVWCHAAILVGAGAAARLAGGWGVAAVVTERAGVLVTAQPGWAEAQPVALFASVALTLATLPAALASRRPLLADLRG